MIGWFFSLWFVYCDLWLMFECSITPDRAVTQITWRPARAGEGRLEMAVSSEDGSIRVYAFDAAG